MDSGTGTVCVCELQNYETRKNANSKSPKFQPNVIRSIQTGHSICRAALFKLFISPGPNGRVNNAKDDYFSFPFSGRLVPLMENALAVCSSGW